MHTIGFPATTRPCTSAQQWLWTLDSVLVDLTEYNVYQAVPSRNPIVDVMVTILEDGVHQFRPDGHEVQAVNLPALTAKFDFTVTFTNRSDHLSVGIAYATDLFDESTANRFGEHISMVLTAFGKQPAAPAIQLGTETATPSSNCSPRSRQRECRLQAWCSGRVARAGSRLLLSGPAVAHPDAHFSVDAPEKAAGIRRRGPAEVPAGR